MAFASLYYGGRNQFSGDEMRPITIIGAIAAICATGSYIPQILKIRKQGGEDLSYPMLFLYLTGTILWLVYGLILNAAAIIWANTITALLVIIAITLKMTYSPQRQDSASRK
jgi:MtN3 and saliva related transmembrane protein